MAKKGLFEWLGFGKNKEITDDKINDIEKAEAEKAEAERAEAEKAEAEKAEAKKAEAKKAEAEKAEAERAEAEKTEAERAEAERAEAERAEAERAEAERAEAERAEAEKTEAERAEAERVEAKRAEAERAEAERAEAERAEAERVEAKRAEAERAEAERAEAERAEAERAEAEKVEAERAEAERAEAEKAEAEKAEAERAEVEKAEAEKDMPKKKEGFFSKLFKGLEKTRQGIMSQIDSMLKGYGKIDEELYEELEELLIMADVGLPTTQRIIGNLKKVIKANKIVEATEVKDLLKKELSDILTENELGNSLNINPSPAIILVVGVNGVGKTTTIGKLAAKLSREGKKVLLVAGDTFRAAAIEQLTEWSKRADVDIIAHQEGADSSAVIFDGIQAAKARDIDVLICDTAGRLHNKKNLMNELNKIFRVVEREYPDAKKEVLLVVDATTGQNAIVQAKAFKEVCDITGIVLTKLDGTAKGGVVLAVQSEINVPVKLVAVGEKIDDLQDFEPNSFVNAIFE